MAGGMKFDADIAEFEFLAIGDGLRGAREIVAVAQPHHVERFLRGQHRAMAGPGVVGMAVGDHGALDRAHRIDMEAAGLAAQAGGDGHQDVLRAHVGYIGAVTVIFKANVKPMPARLFLSSGDMIADRRFDFARDLQLKGDLVAAADLLQQATDLAPGFASAWFTLGEVREQLGEREAAIAAFRKSCRRGPRGSPRRQPAADAARRRQLSAMPPAYVRALFDQYAPRFETALVDDLGYRGPCAVVQGGAVRPRRDPQAGLFQARHRSRLRHRACGGRIRQANVDEFIGIDLSPRMIEQARATGLYARLEVAEMVEGLRGKPDASADLILAADAMVYLSDLAPLLREAKRVLVPGGLLAFTVETHGGDGVILGEGLRYAHSAGYVRGSHRSRRPHAVAAGKFVGPQRGQHAGARSGRGGRQSLTVNWNRPAFNISTSPAGPA